MAPVVATIEVDRPAEEVFTYAIDPSRFSEWQKGVTAGHLEGPGEPSVGARCVTTRRIGFADRPITSEITHLDPPRTWGLKGVDGPIRARVDVMVEPLTDSRSRLTITIDFEGHGVGRILVPLVVVPEARKEMPENLAKLRRQLQCPA
jgi:uncharacterized protein YndB with AHSA1/START domain